MGKQNRNKNGNGSKAKSNKKKDKHAKSEPVVTRPKFQPRLRKKGHKPRPGEWFHENDMPMLGRPTEAELLPYLKPVQPEGEFVRCKVVYVHEEHGYLLAVPLRGETIQERIRAFLSDGRTVDAGHEVVEFSNIPLSAPVSKYDLIVAKVVLGKKGYSATAWTFKQSWDDAELIVEESKSLSTPQFLPASRELVKATTTEQPNTSHLPSKEEQERQFANVMAL
jgi:hypothetical protein